MSDESYPLPQQEPPHHGRLWLAAAIVLLVLVSAVGVTWFLIRNGPSGPATSRPVASPAPSTTPCPRAGMRVVAAPEIAPVIRAAAGGLTPGGQRCPAVEVVAEEPGVTIAAKARPDVWVPSSSVWLRAAGEGYTIAGDPLAYSPIMLAGPKPIIEQISRNGQTGWTRLIEGMVGGRIPVATMPDAQRTTTGMLSVYGVHAATARATPDRGIAQLRAFTLRSRLDDASGDPVSVLERLAGQADANAAVYGSGVFPVTEQQLTAYQRGGHPIQLAGAAPVDGPVEADYPYAIHENAPRDLARRLRAAISGPDLTAAGFRTEASEAALELPKEPEKLLGPARRWVQYRTMPFQVLLLIDASGSMNDKITDRAGAGTTKAALLRQSGVSAAQLFGEETSLGMWYFGATSTGPAHTEEVPFGPLADKVGGQSRRDLMGKKIAGYQAVPQAATPLFQSVLDGVETMRGRAKPDAATVVVVLTDGNDQGSRFAMTQETFRKRLADGNDPGRPVPIIAVGFGPTADMQVLKGMADATGGRAIAAQNPADLASAVAQAFLAARGA